VTAFVQGLQELGWTDGRNVRIDFRWGAGDAERLAGRWFPEMRSPTVNRVGAKVAPK
jgi:hypothetical protein